MGGRNVGGAVMSVPTFEPQISVVLKKNVGRKSVTGGNPTSQRFQDSSHEIDLTPFLGDGSVTVSKSIREPAGMFSIVLADRISASLDTIYAAIEPMDVIEIRMARDVSKYTSSGFTKNMPIMMRGFVTDVTRDEGIGQDGRPARSVTVNGQDYGKILQIMQIAYLTNEVTGQLLLTYLKFFENYDPNSQANKPAAQFIQDMNSEVVLKFLADMRAAGGGGSPVLDIQVDASVTQGVVAPFGTVQSFEGSVYQMMCKYGDVGPWNELFIEDREAGVFLVYRPTPFKDPSGGLIQPDAPSPTVVAITDIELMGLSVGRSDAGVYNYYWVNPLTFNLNTPGYAAIKAAHAGDINEFYIGTYANSSTSLYGFRRMQVDTQQGPRFDGQPESKYNDGTSVTDAFISNRRGVLRDNNKDIVLFEQGNMRLRGNEAIRAGVTVSLTRGSETKPSEYYAISVSHTFMPFRSFTSTVSFERGTGFIKRVQDNGASPYLAEMSVTGVYDGQ
jgi:hypothetical protein